MKTSGGGAESPWSAMLLCSAGALLVSAFFFPPHLWLIRLGAPESFEWFRALSYLKQCAHPLSTDVEPAMAWRFVPQVFAWALGLGPRACLAIPLLGVVALTLGSSAVLLRTPGLSRGQAFAGLVFVTTTAPVLCATGWLGINDAWTVGALLLVAFTGRPSWLVVAALVGPWIDERFFFGLPAALTVRGVRRGFRPTLAEGVALGASLLPYVVIRLGPWRHFESDPSAPFLHSGSRIFVTRLIQAPIGWWMGIRMAVFPLWFGFEAVGRRYGLRAAVLAGLTLAFPLIALGSLASDNVRSAGIALPWILFGFEAMVRAADTRRWVVLCAVLQVVVPAAQVTADKFSRIDPLPAELYRLL